MTGNDLLTANAAEARTVLDGVLADRIRLEPDIDAHRYRLTLPIAFERSDPGGTGVQRDQTIPQQLLIVEGGRPSTVDIRRAGDHSRS